MLSRIQAGEEELREERDYSMRIVSSTPALICGIAPDGTTTFINPAGERVTGYKYGEIVGQNWLRTLHPGDEYRQVERFFRDLERGEVTDYEMTLTAKDGTKRIIAWNSSMRFDEEGQLVELIGFGTDVTERKLAEAERNRLIAIAESTSDLVSTATPDGQLTYMNRAGRKLLGWGVDEDITTRWVSDVHPDWTANLVLQQGLPTADREGAWTGETAVLQSGQRRSCKEPRTILRTLSTRCRRCW